MLTFAAAAVDHAFLATIGRARRPAAVEAHSVDERLARIAEFEAQTHRQVWIDDPDGFFGTMRPMAPLVTRVGVRLGVEAWHVRYDSVHPTVIDGVGERYRSFARNNIAHARWLRTGCRRPAIIAIHGYGGGNFSFEARIFGVRRWLAAGIDVVLVALPFHGPRRRPGDRLRFPSAIPLVTVEGFRQTIRELRALRAWLSAQGAPWVGVVGMSLGGYTASLLATVDPLPLCMAYIPLASLARYAHDKGRLPGTPREQAQQVAGLERVYRVVSPLGRPPRTTPENMMVAVGKGDRITPPDHGASIARHFGCPCIQLPGGHLLQLGRGVAWSELDRRIRATS